MRTPVLGLVGKLPVTVVARIVATEEVGAADTIELNQIARDVSPDFSHKHATSHHLIALATGFLVVRCVLHILFRLAAAVAALHPVTIIAYPWGDGHIHSFQDAHLYVSHVTQHDACRTIDHGYLLAFKISQPVQGVLVAPHRHIGISLNNVARYVFHHNVRTDISHQLQLATNSRQYCHVLTHAVRRESGSPCNK